MTKTWIVLVSQRPILTRFSRACISQLICLKRPLILVTLTPSDKGQLKPRTNSTPSLSWIGQLIETITTLSKSTMCSPKMTSSPSTLKITFSSSATFKDSSGSRQPIRKLSKYLPMEVPPPLRQLTISSLLCTFS